MLTITLTTHPDGQCTLEGVYSPRVANDPKMLHTYPTIAAAEDQAKWMQRQGPSNEKCKIVRKQAALHAFCDAVASTVHRMYRLEDGGDLCWNLVESGVVQMKDGVDSAARIVAQHIEQA